MTASYNPGDRPYRGSVAAHGLLFLSGRLGMADGRLPETVGEQTEQALRNVAEELSGQGLALTDLVKVIVFLDDMTDYEVMNQVYLSVMPQPLPARTCIAVHALPYGGLVEVEAVAALPTS